MPPNQIDNLSRSAGSPALPTAITTRPQLASSPRDRRFHQRRIGDRHRDAARRFFRHRAFDHDLDQLARAFAVARDLLGEIGEHALQRLLNVLERAGRRARDARTSAALPVAKIISVSEVEVSPSMVTALNVSTTPSSSMRLQGRRGNCSVGENEGQHGRHVGRDHAGALGDAVDGDRCLADVRGRRSPPSGKCRWS